MNAPKAKTNCLPNFMPSTLFGPYVIRPIIIRPSKFFILMLAVHEFLKVFCEPEDFVETQLQILSCNLIPLRSWFHVSMDRMLASGLKSVTSFAPHNCHESLPFFRRQLPNLAVFGLVVLPKNTDPNFCVVLCKRIIFFSILNWDRRFP